MAPRAIWGGALSFGLVNVPVKLYPATRSKDVRFNQLHATDGARIRQKREDLSGEGKNLLPYVTNPTLLNGVDLASVGPAGASVLDLMFAQGMEQLLEEMRRDYDLVLIDTPALLEFPDARVFAKLADGSVLVVQAAKTPAEEVRAAAQRLQWDDSVLLGTVLNRV